MTAIISYLTKIRFGIGVVACLQQELEKLGVQNPVVVTDRGLMSCGLIDQVLQMSGIDKAPPIYADTPENPTELAAEDAVKLLKDAGGDGIIAIGGGSSIDLAKAVSMLATHEPPLEQYAAIRGGLEKIRPNTLPLIAVPTTAGTGSEVGRATLITLHNQRKLGFVSPNLIPSVAVCDPELTRSLPPFLTAATGMDAIAHCVETFLSPKENPPAEAIALDGLARAWGYIRAAVINGADMKARSEMMMAALEGALAFQKGLGAIHSISHALGGMKNLKLHHGTLNAVLLPTVMRFNEPVCVDKYARLREAMGLEPNADLSQAFAELNADIGLPGCLGEMGVPRDVLTVAAEWSYEDHSTATNPRPATREDFAQMIEEAMG